MIHLEYFFSHFDCKNLPEVVNVMLTYVSKTILNLFWLSKSSRQFCGAEQQNRHSNFQAFQQYFLIKTPPSGKTLNHDCKQNSKQSDRLSQLSELLHAAMALKLKVLKNVPPNDGGNPSLDPGEGSSRGPAVTPQAEARRRDHIYNQTALQGW